MKKNLLRFLGKVFESRLFEYGVLTSVLLAALFTRFYKVENPVADWHSWRQADTASVTKTYVTEGINMLYPKYHDISSIQTGTYNPNGYRFVEFPIFNLIHASLYNTFGMFTLDVWGRLTSIFSALISIIFIYLIGKRYLGKFGGLVAATVYGLLPYNVYFTRVILPEPMAVAFGLISVWCFIRYSDLEKNIYLYLAGVFLALGILVKPFVGFYAVPMLYLVLKDTKPKVILRSAAKLIPLLAFVNIVLDPFLLWRSWISKFPEGIPFFVWAFNGDNIRFKPSFWRWIFGERVGHLILGSWGLIPFAIGVLDKTKGFFNHFFLFGMFLYVATLATANVRHDYYQTFIVPAIALTFSQGVVFLWKSDFFSKNISRTILIFSVGTMFITGALQIKEFYKINHPEIIQAGAALSGLIPRDSLVVAPYNGDTAFLYQTERWGWPFVDRPIDELIRNGADYYISVNFDAQTNEFIAKFEALEQNQAFVILDLHKPKS